MSNNFSNISKLHSGRYRPDIDGLRAIAVLTVVISHAFPKILPGGFIGVDIFFVISGYLISSILINDLNSNSFSIAKFYNRRIKRIFPALISVLIFILIFGWFCLFKTEFYLLGKHILASTLFSENFLLWSEASYFDVSSELKPTLHLWSLAIEEQFYIFWPLIIFSAYRLRFNLAIVISILLLSSFGINIYYIHNDMTAAYYSPLGRSWELMVGVLLAYLKNKDINLPINDNIKSFFGILLIILSLVFIRPEKNFPGFYALLPTFGALLILYSSSESWINSKILSNPIMIWFGLISYPLYLWHWPFLSFGRIIFGYLDFLKATLCVVSAIIAAYLTFEFIEKPIRLNKSKNMPIILLVSLMSIIIATSVFICLKTLRPRLVNFDAPTKNEWEFLQKMSGNSDKNATGLYKIQEQNNNLILFIGDSHLAQYAIRINKIVSESKNKYGAVLYVGGGCIPINQINSDDLTRMKCWPLRDEAYKASQSNNFKTVIIGGSWYWYFSSKGYYYEDKGRKIYLTSDEGKNIALSLLAKDIKNLTNEGKRVVLILDNPSGPLFNPSGAKLRLKLGIKNYTPNMVANVINNQIVLKNEMAKIAKANGAEVIDPFESLCNGNICKVTSPSGQPLYKDNGHLNPDWVVNNASFVDSVIK